MSKKTFKYCAAIERGLKLGLTHEQMHGDGSEGLYLLLQKLQYAWDGNNWASLKDEPADPASQLIRIRVWADAEVVEDFSADIAKVIEGAGFGMVEKSPVYTCRPPKQLEGCVYLTFNPPAKKSSSEVSHG